MLIIRKIIIFICIAAFAFSRCGEAFAEELPYISAESAVLVNGAGQVLFEKNSDRLMPIASTTKLMTALLAVENANLNDVIVIEDKVCGTEGSSMYLRAGDKLSVKELLLGLLLVSGNDAAAALAVNIGGSEENFVRMMNMRAKELGMNDTSFANPHGLDAEKHFSTAGDMSKLMCRCMENETFRELCGTKSVVINGESFVNHNRLLWRYNYCVAGKTGYTMSAGRCLVSASEKNGTRLVCVTLHDSDDWNDHIKLYNWGFSNYSTRNLLESVEYELPLISNSCDTARILPADEINYFLPNNKNVKYTVELPAFVFPPVKIGETAGRIWVIIDNEIVGGCELVYAESIE